MIVPIGAETPHRLRPFAIGRLGVVVGPNGCLRGVQVDDVLFDETLLFGSQIGHTAPTVSGECYE